MITIALQSDSFMGTMNHEMVHYIRKANPAGYDAMRALVFQLANKSGIDMERRMAEYEELYGDAYGEDVQMADIMEEVVADGFQKIIDNKMDLKEFLGEMYQRDRTILDKIKEFLERMGETIKALFEDNTYHTFAEDLSRDLRNVQLLRRKFAEVLVDTGKMAEREDGAEQTGKEKYSLNKNFAKEYDAWDGKKYIAFHIGETSEALKKIGLETKKIIWHSEKIKKIKQKHKGMTDEVMKQVPEILEKPIIVMKSSLEKADGGTSRITIFGEVKDAEGVPVLAVLELQPKNKNDVILDFQVIASAYGKTNKIKNFIENSEVLYLDENKKRTDTWLKSFWLQSPSGITEYGSIGSVTYTEKGVKIEGSPYLELAQKTEKDNSKRVTKFSLQKTVEETKDLIAVHNLKAADMDRALQIGGFPMPSIAIVKDSMGHEKYGEISAVFGRETIDPQADRRNAVYGGDAWTPTVPQIDYEVNDKKRRAIENEMETLARGVANGIFARTSILAAMGIDNSTTLSKRELAEKLASDDAIRAAYLAEQGKDIAPIYKEKVYDKYGNEFLQEITDHYGAQALKKLAEKLEMGEELDKESVSAIREVWKQDQIKKMTKRFRKKTPEEIAKRAEQLAEETVGAYEAGVFILHAWEMYQDGGGVSEEIDRFATSDRLREETNYKDVADWAEGKLDGLLGEAGVYNGKEPYTASGNRRSFQQLHYGYTLENIVKAMNQTQEERGEGLWGASGEGLVSVATPAYGSIEEIRADKSRLQKMNDEEYRERLKVLDGEIMNIIQAVKDSNEAHLSNSFMESDIISTVLLEAAKKKGKPTAQSVKKYFAAEGYKITDSLAKEILGLYADAATIPAGYFEAKPKRAVGLEEIRALVIPDSMDAEMKSRLERQDIPLLEYAEGDEADRLRVLNSVEDVKFSIRKKDVEANTAENENWRAAYEGLLREFEITREPLKDREAAKRVARKFLKSIQSGYDEQKFLDRFASLCNYGADMQSDSDYKDLVTACAMLAEDALRESADINTELYDTYADFRRELQTSTLHIGKETLNDLAAQDIKYNELRQENFGRVRLSQKEGESIDTKYAEWAERYPELFKMDQNTSQSELLMDIIAVRKGLDPIVENPYFSEMEEQAEASAYELLSMMNDVALEKPTFADKYEERLRKLREENKAALKNAKEKARNEKRLLQEKYATNAEARIAVVKEKYEKRIDRNEYWRMRRLAVKDAKALAEWMQSPADSKHIPKKFQDAVGVILGLLETEKPDLKIPLQSFITMKGTLQELYGDTQGIYLYVE